MSVEQFSMIIHYRTVNRDLRESIKCNNTLFPCSLIIRNSLASYCEYPVVSALAGIQINNQKLGSGCHGRVVCVDFLTSDLELTLFLNASHNRNYLNVNLVLPLGGEIGSCLSVKPKHQSYNNFNCGNPWILPDITIELSD